MRTYQEVIRAISVRWLIKKTLRTAIYCLNPFRLIKWFIYLVLGAIFLGVFTLVAGNYARAAEWAAAKQVDTVSESEIASNCYIVGLVQFQSFNVTASQCLAAYNAALPSYKGITLTTALAYSSTTSSYRLYKAKARRAVDGALMDFYMGMPTSFVGLRYICPPDGNPDFTFGPKVTANGTVCEKKPIECLIGSIKETNVITGKEFCRPICNGIAGNSLDNVSYFQSNFGSVQIQCYGQCSIQPSGVSVSSGLTPNIYTGDVTFTGENCPVQTNGQTDTVDQSGDVAPPDSSDATNGAQDQLQNAASGAISNTVSGATGTADLNAVVDKIAEASNAEIKASSEQNAALGKVIQNTGKDIQASIKEAQLSASQGGAGANMGQIQTANAIKDGNAQLGGKLDAIKDAIEAGNEDGEEEPDPTLPPGDTEITVDPNDVNPNPNDWSARNYSTVMQHHVAAMNELPLFSSISGFFEVNTGAGTCPSFSIDVPEVGGVGGGSIVFDAFCNSDLQKIFEIIALCVKLLGLYVAFRIALLD
ncbi:hypothetical protein [Aeromonas media]|uniref:hypothetical protein n=1 Tax=Aeromonas media TaxID=651 RepID=UPI0038D02B90